MEEDRNSSVRSRAPVIVGIVGSLILPCLFSFMVLIEMGSLPGGLFIILLAIGAIGGFLGWKIGGKSRGILSALLAGLIGFIAGLIVLLILITIDRNLHLFEYLY